MSASQTLTTLGLLMDILGAGIVAWNVFASNPKQAVDAGYLDQREGIDGNFYAAPRVEEKCKEANFVRIGIVILTFGFGLQILGQAVSHIDWYGFALFSLVVLIDVKLILQGCDQLYRKDALIELCKRSIQYRGGHMIYPSGFDCMIFYEFAQQIAPFITIGQSSFEERMAVVHQIEEWIERRS